MRPMIAAVVIIGFFCLLSACGGPSERISEKAAIPASPTPTPSEREISGVFKVEGAGLNNNPPYNGILNIAPMGEVYEFRWTTTKGSRIGRGVQIGNHTAVSYAAIGGGKGCGVMLFKIASDGSLEGRSARWGSDQIGTEKAKRIEGQTFVGKYEVNGTFGPEYEGTLTIKKNGSGYEFDWNLDDGESGPFGRIAFGTWRGSFAAASFGGRQCGFALYDVLSNGDLEGVWGGQAAVTFGTETAKRQ